MLLEEEEWVKHALIEKERKRCISKIIKYDRRDAVSTGNNYMSDIYRLNLKVVLNSGETEERSVMYKVLPTSENKFSEAKQAGMFTKEARMYTEILPAMERLLNTKLPNTEIMWPHLYGVKSDHSKFLIEDLSVLGYKMCDRTVGLDYEHASLAIKTLATFHALAAVLIKQGDIITSEFDKYFFLKDEEKAVQLYDKVLENLVQAIKDHWSEEWQEYVEPLLELKKTIGQRVLECMKRDESQFNTLNHGDYWLNNMLFKYDSDGKPQNVRALDFQLGYYNNPCCDIQYFMNTSLNTDILHTKPKLLEIYYDALKNALEHLDYGEGIPSFEYITNCYERTKLYGFTVSLFLGPFFKSTELNKLAEEHPEIDKEDRSYVCYAYSCENVLNPVKLSLKTAKGDGIL